MSNADFSITVNPIVLTWARQSAGQTIADVANRLHVSSDIIEKWETGKKAPAWQSLRKLASCYQRPLAALLLPEPPAEPDLPTDYRTTVGAKRKLSPETLLAIRTARWLQSRAIEMHQELGRESRFLDKQIRVMDSAESAAAGLRDEIGIAMREQIEWESARDAYRHWRESLQEQDILVFQLRFPRNELQGFSLFHLTRPVIVVNEIDGVEARIFTLFHERAHLMLREPGLCLPQKVATSVGSSVEPFCNRFAASFLIPELEAQSWKADTSTVEALEAWIRRAAARYHVSKYVILIRLKSIERISQDSFSRLYKKWDRGKTDQQNTLRPREKRQGGGPSAGQVCLRQRGKAFISLVFDAANRGLVTTRDAAMFLGVKPKDLNRLEPKA